MFFPRGDKSIQRQRIFAHMGVDQEGDFSMQFAERGIRRKRHLHDVPYAAHVDEHLARSFFGEPSAKLANHRSPVLPLFFRPSTRSRTSPPVFAKEFGLGNDVALHRPFQVSLCNAWFEIQLRIERIQFEKISVWLTRRRTRPAVADFAEVISALARAAGKLLLARQPLRKFPCVRGNVIQNPVPPTAPWGAGSSLDARKSPRSRR